ncbi:MAG: bifunctional oligoribonuclease/PAP phosphatase NrnA [Candidatus Omnitrophota bacterium]
MSLKKVLNAIKKHKKFIVSAHINLEGDALGAELALARLLKKMGKKVSVVNADKSPKTYDFLPGVKSIINSKKRIPDYDVLIAVDCCDERRLGSVSKLIKKDKITINIDHHKSNNRFGDVNWVMPEVSSAAELVYHMFKKLNYRLDRMSALLLYVGILTDTGSFRYSNTNAGTHRIVAELLSKNLSANKIYQKIYEANPLAQMKLVTSILNSFQTDNSNKIAWVKIESDELRRLNSRVDIADNIFDFLRSIKGVEVAMIFKQINSRLTKVNLRSRGRIDVARLAGSFGGGGHRAASGCSIEKGIKQSEQLVLKKLKRII